PVANLVFWLARFGILVAAALLIASGGEAVSWTVFLAWIGPGVAVAIWVNYIIFAKLVPAHAKRPGRSGTLTRRQIGRFLAADYIGSIFTLLMNYGVPVMVAAQVSREMNAYYGLTIQLGAMLEMLSYTMSS